MGCGLHAATPPSQRQEEPSAAMFVARNIDADHKDFTHDVNLNFHRWQMATCSSDQSVKVWDRTESGDCHCIASWKTHSGSVWCVTWAHPEFGQVLASCSFDRTAAVWEEIVGESNDKLRGQSHWVRRWLLVGRGGGRGACRSTQGAEVFPGMLQVVGQTQANSRPPGRGEGLEIDGSSSVPV